VTGSLVSPAARQRVRDLATPIATALGRLGLTPNALTIIGFLGTCAAGIAAGLQQWLVAGILVLAFGIFDLFDGALARATGSATKLGAFLDSTFDRAGEGIVYIGIAVGCSFGAYDLHVGLAAAAMTAAFMVSYTRAKAESLGFSPGSGLMNVGLAPREVRVAILGIGLILTGLTAYFSPHESLDCAGSSLPPPDFFACLRAAGQIPGEAVLAWTLTIITILATVTTVQRILHVRAQSREG
jgi:CDP-diacylglycerol--glycerol-3-phosphate 3-phosphatidyltransferase